MNKTAIKNFATWARRKLISEITYKAGLIGITEKGVSQPLSISTDNIQFFDIGTGKPTEISDNEIQQREALINRIKDKESTSDYKTAYQFVIEEVSYTWFNRLIAIRFMEVNDYLPSRIRVLSSETPGKSEPDMVTTPFDTDMVFSAYEKDRVMQLKHENELDELFRILFIKQCNKLNEVLPELFEKTADYTELLLNISFTDDDGMVSHLVNDIVEDDFKEAVEIIGWLYQYYNSEPKDEAFLLLKKNIKISKERIPAATQLFTPDWIVRYMVENTLGKMWLEGHPNESLKSEWKYYIQSEEQEQDTKIQLDRIRIDYKSLNPEDIKVIDPCMGSGHVLVYAFDVLMKIYENQGYTQKDAAVAIISNNLFGLDIDDRAHQLAYFSVIMKARKYDRRFLTKGIYPKLYAIKESNEINKKHLEYFGKSLTSPERDIAVQQIEYLLNIYNDAKEYGSILTITECNWELLCDFLDDIQFEEQLSIAGIGLEQSQRNLKLIVKIAQIMGSKYDVVITNPPYMKASSMNEKLAKFVKTNYYMSKSDMFAVFIERANLFTKCNGHYALITQPSLITLSSYEDLRLNIIDNSAIDSILHMGRGIFGIDFGSVAFVVRKSNFPNYRGNYFRLHERTFQFINPYDIETLFLKSKNDLNYRYNFSLYKTQDNDLCEEHCDDSDEDNEDILYSNNEMKLHYFKNQSDFKKIPGTPYAFWLSDNMFRAFTGKHLVDFANCCTGMQTGNNEKYIRYWFEVNLMDTVLVNKKSKYKLYNCGGDSRKWYGNHLSVIKWGDDGAEIKSEKSSVIRNERKFYKEGISWKRIGSKDNYFRYLPEGFIFDQSGDSMFPFDKKNLIYLLGFLNSIVAKNALKAIAPTINLTAGNMNKLPIVISENDIIIASVEENITLSKFEWDSYEVSWDFKRNPLLSQDKLTLEDAFITWESLMKSNFDVIKKNEIEINRNFIEVYSLQGELEPNLLDIDIVYRTANFLEAIKELISYAVGCMFGRYSIDSEGLIFAGGEWDENKYISYKPDKDNCIPITDEEYLSDDIVGRFVQFINCVYGQENLEKNLEFIAKSLNNKGNTPREIIRNYFIKDFYKDHTKTYLKRPIYWLYDSGKQDGFKALVYMHRYTPDTTGIVRVDYLHKMQKIYMSEIDRMKELAENSNIAREVAQAEKRKEKLIKQLKETNEYDEKIAHLALSRIAIDLDDGVKVNYDKVQTGQDGKKLDILGKI
jgi:hypothetical protein